MYGTKVMIILFLSKEYPYRFCGYPYFSDIIDVLGKYFIDLEGNS